MGWIIRTLEPDTLGANYICVVNKPAGFTPDMETLIAEETAVVNSYELPYIKAEDAKASEDHWDTGIPFTNGSTRDLVIKAMENTNEKGKDEPTVADGAGGGDGIAAPKLIKVCKLGTFYRLA